MQKGAAPGSYLIHNKTVMHFIIEGLNVLMFIVASATLKTIYQLIFILIA